MSFDIPQTVTPPVCNDFAQASQLEWLATNHTGAFAMGTVAGVNTRRYHGLLIATLNPPSDRYSILPRVEETIKYGGQLFPLAAVQYPGLVAPAGYELIEEFTSSPCPRWRYRCDNLTLQKSIRLLEGRQTVVVSYQADAACEMQLRLFVSFRDYHSLGHRNNSLNPQVSEHPGQLAMRPYENLPILTLHHNAQSFESNAAWFDDHEYLRELERGLDFREDLYSPGILHYSLTPETPVHLVATLEDGDPDLSQVPPSIANPLTRALDQFRVTRADKKPTLIAGYPWFTDWSRDTLISLPALIASGFHPDETRGILDFLLSERKQGILPNRFTDRQSTPEHNTVDASLWCFIAAHAYLNVSQDGAFLRNTLFPAALDIIEWHRRGTFYAIHVDPLDHLLSAGEAGTQLTWMDAKVGDYVVTPRLGKAVEINALWFNALHITAQWASQVGDLQTSQALLVEASAMRKAFLEKFWNPARGCLFDVLTPSGPDSSFRPNQLFAASLPFPLLERAHAQSMVEAVKELLLTPAGLRTLEPADPNYRSRFDGDMSSRDSAYHQGTVWPWLVGPFVSAYLYAFSDSAEAKAFCRQVTTSILKLTNGYCLGTVGEVFDADPPHHPGGCPAQLWSVAQLILALQRLDDH
jgi:predicted glycogen debranching enzyme